MVAYCDWPRVQVEKIVRRAAEKSAVFVKRKCSAGEEVERNAAQAEYCQGLSVDFHGVSFVVIYAFIMFKALRILCGRRTKVLIDKKCGTII
jgi:hypothetical protein